MCLTSFSCASTEALTPFLWKHAVLHDLATRHQCFQYDLCPFDAALRLRRLRLFKTLVSVNRFQLLLLTLPGRSNPSVQSFVNCVVGLGQARTSLIAAFSCRLKKRMPTSSHSIHSSLFFAKVCLICGTCAIHQRSSICSLLTSAYAITCIIESQSQIAHGCSMLLRCSVHGGLERGIARDAVLSQNQMRQHVDHSAGNHCLSEIGERLLGDPLCASFAKRPRWAWSLCCAFIPCSPKYLLRPAPQPRP